MISLCRCPACHMCIMGSLHLVGSVHSKLLTQGHNSFFIAAGVANGFLEIPWVGKLIV